MMGRPFQTRINSSRADFCSCKICTSAVLGGRSSLRHPCLRPICTEHIGTPVFRRRPQGETQEVFHQRL
jgi:hypothetical protein